MNSLYYTSVELLAHDYECEVEYEWEPEETATPTSPPSPARASINRVTLMEKKSNGEWAKVEIKDLLNSEQERNIQAQIIDYVPRLGLPRPVKARSYFADYGIREAA